jgi:hypothetical protein
MRGTGKLDEDSKRGDTVGEEKGIAFPFLPFFLSSLSSFKIGWGFFCSLMWTRIPRVVKKMRGGANTFRAYVRKQHPLCDSSVRSRITFERMGLMGGDGGIFHK